jgi:hypothetical protein
MQFCITAKYGTVSRHNAIFHFITVKIRILRAYDCNIRRNVCRMYPPNTGAGDVTDDFRAVLHVMMRDRRSRTAKIHGEQPVEWLTDISINI